MNPQQRKAVGQLRRALTALDSAGLCMYGMDDTLYVYDVEHLAQVTEQHAGDAYEGRRHADGESVTHVAYRDSGGW